MVSGAVYFSVMTPGARLRPHCGPTNTRLRVRRIAPSIAFHPHRFAKPITQTRRLCGTYSLRPSPSSTLTDSLPHSLACLQVHLALSAPHGACGMRVGNESRLWRDGEAWVFDDSFEHEVSEYGSKLMSKVSE